MSTSSERTIKEIERQHFEATGSDDFDTPAVARRGRQALGFKQGTPEQLYEVACRAINGADEMTADEKAAAKARAKAAVGL